MRGRNSPGAWVITANYDPLIENAVIDEDERIPRRRTIGAATYRLIFRCYPAAFRAEFGKEMLADLHEGLHANGLWWLLARLPQELLGLLVAHHAGFWRYRWHAIAYASVFVVEAVNEVLAEWLGFGLWTWQAITLGVVLGLSTMMTVAFISRRVSSARVAAEV